MYGHTEDYGSVTASGIARHAAKVVSGDRAMTHGESLENHSNIAALWTGYLDLPITPKDVANMMVLLKIARTKAGQHNPDDYLDAVGYAAIAGELAAREMADRDPDPQPSVD